MRYLGFSTGALALSDVQKAITMLTGKSVNAIEVSALREAELEPIVARLDALDLSAFKYKAFHAPSYMNRSFEPLAIELLDSVASRGWPLIVHPDAIYEPLNWKHFGSLLCIENMDKRKPIGQTAIDLERIFDVFPDAMFCFDIGHARQVDPTMSTAAEILHCFKDRLAQLHVSEVNSQSRHDALTMESLIAFQKVLHLVPADKPVIIESRVSEAEINAEIQRVIEALDCCAFLARVVLTPVVSLPPTGSESDLAGVRFSITTPGSDVAAGRFFVSWRELKSQLLHSALLSDNQFSSAEANILRGIQWYSPLLWIQDDQLRELQGNMKSLAS